MLLSWEAGSFLPVELVLGKEIAQPFTIIGSLVSSKEESENENSWMVSVGTQCVCICSLRSETSVVPSRCKLKGDGELPTPRLLPNIKRKKLKILAILG